MFSPAEIEKYAKFLGEDERRKLPVGEDGNIGKFIISYFDDFFLYANTAEEALICLKLVLMISRDAKIKFSIEKSKFLTTKIKVLGYAFDTKDTILQMDELKASGIMNMKKPSSLFELHSRLASFQYQSIYTIFKTHIIPTAFYATEKSVYMGQNRGNCMETGENSSDVKPEADDSGPEG